MGLLISWLVSTIAIIVTAYFLPGVHISSLTAALVTAVILGIVNAILKPLLILFTLPLTILTLGLFTFVINALMILLVSAVVPGFKVDGFWWALLFSIVMSIVNSILLKLTAQFE
ncbi:MAG TPA: phage holin family protein [Candidatus Saccharimonadales bacterium]|nr:phage holin family protein [Candidatus Saccharimonadales bacterium]